MPELKDPAVCRGCGRKLIGDAYCYGGAAYHPVTKERVKTCHYGGFVCSEQCDRRATLELERTMPGHVGQRSLGHEMSQRITNKWLQRQ